MKLILTGAAGFIGIHLTQKLLSLGHEVLGVDSLNDYYDPSLKEKRLERLRGEKGFRFEKLDLADSEKTADLFLNNAFDSVVHLAAQAGVRYSLENPHAYVDSCK